MGGNSIATEGNRQITGISSSLELVSSNKAGWINANQSNAAVISQ